MRLDASAPVAAPQAEVFRRLSDFDRLASRIGSDAVTVIYLFVIASEFSEKWIPLFGPML